MRRKGIAGLVAMLIVGLFFAVVSAIEGTSVSTMHLMSYAIATLFAGIATNRFADHPQDFMDLDKLFVCVIGAYVVLPFMVACFFPGIGFDEYLQMPTLECALLAMAGFAAGLIATPPRLLLELLPARDEPWVESEGMMWSAGFIFIGAILLTLLIQRVGLSTYFQSDYVDAYAAENGLGYLVAGIPIGEVGLFIYFLARSRPGKQAILPFVLFAIISAASLRAGRRRMPLEAGLGMLALQHFWVKKIRLRTVTILLVAVIPLFTIIGQARAFLAQGWEGMRTYALFEFDSDQWVHSLDDFNAVAFSLVNTTNFIPGREPYRFGRTYAEGFEVLIPMKLHPNRPLTPAQWLVWSSEDAFAASGGGYSFSHIAEAYMNFSYFGVFLVCLIEGILVRTLVEYRRECPTSQSRMLIYVCFLTTVITLVRGDFASWLKEMFVLLAAALPTAMYLGSWREQKRAPIVRGPMRETPMHEETVYQK